MCSNHKRGELLWLIDRAPLIILNGETVGFKSAKPPTNADVLVQLKAYHAYLQKTTNLQSSLRDAFMKVYIDLIDWWKRTGITLMSKPAIINKIKELHETWNYLHRYRDQNNCRKKQKESFKVNCLKTFWPVSINVQKKWNNQKIRG